MIHEFDPIIYPCKLWIIVDKSTKIISEEFNDYNNNLLGDFHNETCRLEAFAMMAVSKRNMEFGIILFFRDKKSMISGTVAHECVHASKHLFEHITADPRDHETFEYLVEW